MKTSNLSFAQSRTKAINDTVKTQSGEAFAFANISGIKQFKWNSR